jgi:hypothetical protein
MTFEEVLPKMKEGLVFECYPYDGWNYFIKNGIMYQIQERYFDESGITEDTIYIADITGNKIMSDGWSESFRKKGNKKEFWRNGKFVKE